MWLVLFFVAPVAMVVWFSFGYKPGIFGTHANDVLSFDRYVEAMSPDVLRDVPEHALGRHRRHGALPR